MEQKSAREIQQALALPFAPEDLEWRLQTTNKEKTRGLAIPYVTNRAIQNRLDDVVGPDHWYNEYKPWHRFTTKVRSERNPSEFEEKEIISQLCGIAIYFEDRKEWVVKWDGAEDTDIEQVKGGLSDSMKRAAVQWGIGRVLYSMNTVWVDIEKQGRSFIIKDGERAKLDEAYLGMLQKLGLKPASAGGLQSLLTPKNMADVPQADAQQMPDAPKQTTAKTGDAAAGQSAAATQPPKSGGAAVGQPAAVNKQQKPAAAETPSAPAAQQPPAYEYVVLDAKVQGGMKSSNTLVTLKGADGKRFPAFVRGVRPELTAGVFLTGVKLTLHRQDTVAYYVLESYTLMELQDNAA